MRRHFRRILRVGAASWNPLSLNPTFYYDSTLGVTLGTGVSGWADQVGAQHWSQGTAANQPTYSSSDSDLGGMPSIDFDGTNDRMTAAGPASAWRFLHDNSGGEIIAVARVDGGAGSTRTLLATTTATAATVGVRLIVNSSNNWSYVVHNGSSSTSATAGSSSGGDGTKRFLSASYGGGTIRIQADDVTGTASLTTPSSSDPTGVARLGAHTGDAHFMNGRVVHLAVFNRVLTTAERDAYRNWLRRRYGLA